METIKKGSEMRLGKIECCFGYVVDLDDEDMVACARESIIEDVANCHDYGYEASFNILHGKKEEEIFTESDIPDFLKEDDEDLRD